MAVTEREFRDVAVEIVNLCEARGLNLKQTGAVCEFLVQSVCITEIIIGAD